MIDNWTLQRAAVSINDTYEKIAFPNEEYIKLVEAIILWDRVHFLNTNYSEYWKNILYRFGYEHYLLPLSVDEMEYNTSYCLSECENLDIVSDKAIMYSTLCNKHSISYLPCKERAEYLRQCNLMPSFNRRDVVDYLDETLKSYYQSLNNRFGKNKISFSLPVLFDYVVANTSPNEFLLQTALQIRMEHEVVEFRKWLENFESKLQCGNLLELEKLLTYLPALISDLTRIIPEKRRFNIQIGLSPSVNFSIPVGKNARNIIHIDFLQTLSSFAISDRKPLQSSKIIL